MIKSGTHFPWWSLCCLKVFVESCFNERETPTYYDCRDGKEHEGVLLQKRLDVFFRDLLHFPLGLHGADVDALPEALHLAVEGGCVSPWIYLPYRGVKNETVFFYISFIFYFNIYTWYPHVVYLYIFL